MALASTPDLASYGFGYRWAQLAYIPGPSQGEYNGVSYEPSSIRTGNTITPTRSQLNWPVEPWQTLGGYPNLSGKPGTFLMAGQNPYISLLGISPPKGCSGDTGVCLQITGTYPAHLNGPSSSIDGGSKMGGLEVVNANLDSYNSIGDALEQDISNSTGPIQRALFNLYELQSPSADSDTESNTLTLSNFYNYNSPLQFLGIQHPFGSPYQGLPNELSFTQNINPEITYVADQGSLDISAGTITGNSQALADGQNLDVTFQFLGTEGSGPGEQFNFDSSFTNSVTSSKTQGTTNLTSQQQSDGGSSTHSGTISGNISISTSATEKAKAGIIFDSASVSATEQAGFQHSWSHTWQHVDTFNATTENSLSSSDSLSDSDEISSTFSFSANINLSGITPTGKTANGTPIYDYETPVKDPTTGQIKMVSFDIVEGEYYQWELSYYQGKVQQVVQGKYGMTGQVGSLDDSSNNSIGGNVAQAYYYAQAGQGFGYANADSGIVASYNTSRDGTNQSTALEFGDVDDPSELRSINIQGSTTAGTAVNNNLSLKLVAISASSGNASSSRLASARNSKRHEISIHEGLALQPHETKNPTGYTGTNQSERLSDSPGQDFIRMGDGHDHVKLTGNTVQKNNDGDIVYLGKGKDKLKAGKAQGFNSVFAGPGRDHVADGKGDLGADLGKGNDTFVHGGGTDYVTLGKGRDTLNIKANATGKDHTLVVHDFHVGDDHITGVRKGAQLNWDDSIHGFRMQGHGDSTIRLHTTGHDDVITPDFWVGLGLQNMHALRLHKRPHNSLRWEHIRKQYGRYGFSKPGVRYQDWDTFSSSADKLQQTVSTLAAIEGKSNLSSSQLEKASGFAEIVDSFHAYIAGVYNILNL